MKVRFQRNSIRFRLASDELEALMVAGEVREQMVLPDSSTFNILLALNEDETHAHVLTNKSGVHVNINRPAAISWVRSNELSLRFILPVSEGGEESSLAILVEKDLPCQSH